MIKLIDKFKTTRKHKQQEDRVISTIEEIIDEREERGDRNVVDSREIPMVKNIFLLRDIRAHDVMTPRVDIDAIPINMPAGKFCRYVAEEKFTRYPVYDGSLDNIVGSVHVKDIFIHLVKDKKCNVKDVLKDNILFISPAMRALDLLKEMQTKQVQLAVIVDEHGGVDGLLSLEDLLEVIVGEIDDEHDFKEDGTLFKHVDKSTVDVNAKMKLEDFEKEIMPVAMPEERENPDIDTIGGWVAHLAGRMPQKGEVIHHPPSNLRFVILSSDSCCIKKIRVTNIQRGEES